MMTISADTVCIFLYGNYSHWGRNDYPVAEMENAEVWISQTLLFLNEPRFCGFSRVRGVHTELS